MVSSVREGAIALLVPTVSVDTAALRGKSYVTSPFVIYPTPALAPACVLNKVSRCLIGLRHVWHFESILKDFRFCPEISYSVITVQRRTPFRRVDNHHSAQDHLPAYQAEQRKGQISSPWTDCLKTNHNVQQPVLLHVFLLIILHYFLLIERWPAAYPVVHSDRKLRLPQWRQHHARVKGNRAAHSHRNTRDPCPGTSWNLKWC